MRPTLIDTDILSLFFRNHPLVVNRFAEYAQEYSVLNLSIITYYEVLSGLLHRDARSQLKSFQSFVEANRMLPLTESAVSIAAKMYAETRNAGQPVDDIDILIAGIAVANGMAVATRNSAHFGKIPGLIVDDWTVPG